jgi:hypothetical protein
VNIFSLCLVIVCSGLFLRWMRNLRRARTLVKEAEMGDKKALMKLIALDVCKGQGALLVVWESRHKRYGPEGKSFYFVDSPSHKLLRSYEESLVMLIRIQKNKIQQQQSLIDVLCEDAGMETNLEDVEQTEWLMALHKQDLENLLTRVRECKKLTRA